MNAALDALATELYVLIVDLLVDHPHLAPARSPVGITHQLSEAELVTLAVLQALLGNHNEARFVRYAHAHLRGLFPYLPQRPAYNKRLRRSVALLQGVLALLTQRCQGWHDDLWLIDSTPVECGRSRETARPPGSASPTSWAAC
jgi:hypothetical protein